MVFFSIFIIIRDIKVTLNKIKKQYQSNKNNKKIIQTSYGIIVRMQSARQSCLIKSCIKILNSSLPITHPLIRAADTPLVPLRTIILCYSLFCSIDRSVHTDATASIIYIYTTHYRILVPNYSRYPRKDEKKITNDRCLKTRLCARIARQLESYLARLQVYYIVSILPGHNKCADCACIIRNSWDKIGNVYSVGSRIVIILLFYYYYLKVPKSIHSYNVCSCTACIYTEILYVVGTSRKFETPQFVL